MANMVVRTNIFALNAHRNMKNVGAEQQRSSNRLASGFRINNAADDAAGLAISESMRSQIRGLDQASRNAQDGQALINTAEGGMQEIQNMLQRIRELTVQAANDTNDDANRGQIAIEIGQLMDEIDAMANRVEFNGMTLLNGDFSPGGSDGTFLSLINNWINKAEEAIRIDALTTADADWPALQGVAPPHKTLQYLVDLAGLTSTWAALESGSKTEQVLAALLSGAGHTITKEQVEKITQTAAVTNAASARELIDAWTAASGLFGANQLWFQTGANNEQGLKAFIDDMRITGAGARSLGNSLEVWTRDWYNTFTLAGSGGNDISKIIEEVQKGIDFVSDARANLGAFSNRLDFTSRSLDISSENLSDAESRVRNTDMAREMMRFTMSNVLQQAAVSMLAQANQLPNNLLQLLR